MNNSRIGNRDALASDTHFADNDPILSCNLPEATVIVRRRLLPILSFLFTAVLVTGQARAQKSGPGRHETLPGSYTPDQIKRALEGFSRGGNLPDLPPELLEMFKDRLQKDGKQPIDDRQLKQALDMMRANPQLKDQVEEMGRKLKNGGGKIGDDERRQLERLMPELQRSMPKNNGGPPPFVNPMPPKNLDPVPPNLDPPKNIDPIPPMPNPNPMVPPDVKGDPLRNLDPNGKNPFDQNQTPREKAAHAAASMWERNIGPLDDTPAVKRALFDLIEGTEDIAGPDGKSFWDELSLEQGDSTPLSDLLDNASLADSWSLPKFELPEWKLFGNSGPDGDNGGADSAPKENWWSRTFGSRTPRAPSEPRAPGSGWSPTFSLPGLQGGWLPVVILAAIIVGGLLVWKFWGVTFSRNRGAAGLFGPGWPLDPRRITTREHVVIAFEYLSVLICGPSAKTWTHNTIAGALADLATTHGEVAVMLARLYELARYAPLDEPLTTAELAEARRLVCALAGLEHE